MSRSIDSSSTVHDPLATNKDSTPPGEPATIGRHALIGYTGFVGSNLLLQGSFTHLYRSTTIADIKGLDFDVITCCGLSAKKWWANAHPEEDARSLQSLQDLLSTVTCRRFILLSTIDVFQHTDLPNDESNSFDVSTQPYGRHRYDFEQFVKATFSEENVFILRLPALFGPFLKKNIIYDMLENKEPQSIRRTDEYQFYPIWHLSRDIQWAVDHDLHLVHLFPPPVSVSDVVETIRAEMESLGIATECFDLHRYHTDGTPRQYRCRSLYYRPTWDWKDAFHEYLLHYIVWKRHFVMMPLSTACYCSWKELSHLLPREWVRFEVAPYTLWGESWETHPEVVSGETIRIHDYDASPSQIVQFHGILYPQTWNVWTQFSKTIAFFRKVVGFVEHSALASHVQGITMGSPKQRRRTFHADFELGIMLRYLQETIFSPSSPLRLGWEINSGALGTDMFHEPSSFRSMIEECPSLSIVLDTDSCRREGVNPSNFFDEFESHIHHVHVSRLFPSQEQQETTTRSLPTVWQENIGFLRHLLQKGYRGYITLELSCPRVESIYDYLKQMYPIP